MEQEVSIYWMSILNKVIFPMFYSPIIGFAMAYILMLVLLQIVKKMNAKKAFHRFRILQIVSSCFMALGHGLQDAQKTMGIMFLAAGAVGWADPDGSIPLWIKLLAAGAISLGTYSGGWRVMKTLGRKIIDLNPSQGFVAEMVSASILYVTAFFVHAPISTTHTITSAIMGVGSTEGFKKVRWATAQNIIGAWFLTLPAAGIMGALAYLFVHWIIGI